MPCQFLCSRPAMLGLTMIALLGTGICATAQTVVPPEALTAEERAALREERRAERRVTREAQRVARLEGEIAFLRARLMITTAQAPVWEAFADALRDQQSARAEARLAPRELVAEPLNFPERLQRRQAALNNRSERLNSFIDVLTPLFAALSVEQRLIADRFLDVDGGRVRIDDD